MQTEEYAGVDQYLKGYRAAIEGAFCPETGWFWTVLSEAHERTMRNPVAHEQANMLYDELVEAVNRELGR